MTKKIIYGCESRGDGDSPYLTRYTLISRPTWQLCLHVFHRSDHDVLHDHPWDFWSLILWRGYIEETAAGKRRVWPGMLLRRKAEHSHRVELLKRLSKKYWYYHLYDELPAVTLVLMFRRRREWGFATRQGWVDWRSYFKWLGC